jgi:hypothetical protein
MSSSTVLWRVSGRTSKRKDAPEYKQSSKERKNHVSTSYNNHIIYTLIFALSTLK